MKTSPGKGSNVDEYDWIASDDPARMLQWLTCTEAWADTGRGSAVKPSDRKLRLLACACCRQVWDRLPDPRSRKAVEVAERYADEGTAAERERLATEMTARKGYDGFQPIYPPDMSTLPNGKAVNAYAAAVNTIWRPLDAGLVLHQTREAGLSPTIQAALLRDLVGNPWRPIPLTCRLEDVPPLIRQLHPQHWPKHHWLSDPTVLAIARRAYDEHCPADSLAVQADALEDAGCESEDVLRHLRGQEVCPECMGTGDAPGSYMEPHCYHCRDSGWQPLRVPHAKGCWVIDLVLGKE